jgi:hypothetical protein
MNVQNKIKKLQKLFPEVWMKDGAEFSNSHKNTIWTGEGSYIDGYSAFSYYDYSNTMGIHPKLEKALNKLDLWAEFYDPGTVFLYED